jgi:hypothetical protein
MAFHFADERRHTVHFHPFAVATRRWPPSAGDRRSRTEGFGGFGARSLFAASIAFLMRDLAGHPVESRLSALFAMAPAMPIHLATITTRPLCLSMALQICGGGVIAVSVALRYH